MIKEFTINVRDHDTNDEEVLLQDYTDRTVFYIDVRRDHRHCWRKIFALSNGYTNQFAVTITEGFGEDEIIHVRIFDEFEYALEEFFCCECSECYTPA